MQNQPVHYYSEDISDFNIADVEHVRVLLAKAAENAQGKDCSVGDTGGSCIDKDTPAGATTYGVHELSSHLMHFLNNVEEYPADENSISKLNVSPSPYCVLVYVTGMTFTYQLLEPDLRKVFGLYGEVEGVQICPGGESAIIRFYTWDDAATSIRVLNDKVLNGVKGRLCVEWFYPPGPQRQVCLSEDSALQTDFVVVAERSNPEAPSLPSASYCDSFGYHPRSRSFVTDEDVSGERGADRTISAVPQDDTGPRKSEGQTIRKYTCRFEIGIENDRDFHVARRIIGTKGVNMKRIVKMSDAKLRLRGRGSGFLEGNLRQESNEPLHLCISCVDPIGYRTATREVEVLLEGIYEEYRSYCKDYNLDFPEGLTVTMKEHPLLAQSSTSVDSVAGGQENQNGHHHQWEGSEGWHGGEFYPRGYFRARDGESAEFEWPANVPSIEEIEKLIDERNEARRMCNFKEADRIRDLLRANGIGLMDEPGGRGKGSEVTTWRFWRQ
ncbi:hypothetical protein FOL47_006818 [Perkinsus chesapeaki]|uniref:RRM domain-containing protein n=1 Tax=Perkinsus chesapeaki TaxID=330153 RepID=A0A7J6MWM1_PERCH|nr:hypothetical protein FOL47_006818 [Perkinsus chesapeaki]